jgi:hypothetical protein
MGRMKSFFDTPKRFDLRPQPRADCVCVVTPLEEVGAGFFISAPIRLVQGIRLAKAGAGSRGALPVIIAILLFTLPGIVLALWTA